MTASVRAEPAEESRPPRHALPGPAEDCSCNGPCQCRVPVPLLRWFAAQVAVYHGPGHDDPNTGRCGARIRACGMCMLVASLDRAASAGWTGVLP